MPTFNIFIQSESDIVFDFCVLLLSLFLIIKSMLVLGMEHIADEWKTVNMLLQIETNFDAYVTCVHTDGPAHLGIFRVYLVYIDPADAQADLGVPCSHMP